MNVVGLSGHMGSTMRLPHRAAVSEAPTDVFARSEVFETPKAPDFKAKADLHTVASKLEAQWAERLPEPKSVVGVIVEKGWVPDGEHDPWLNICDGIVDSGGMPKLMFIGRGDPVEQMRSVDALALPGGRDIDPSKYGAERGPGMKDSKPDPEFDDFEIACLQYGYESGMPIQGHCRGGQIMNVAGGGTMVQDIPTEFTTREGWGSKYGTVIDHRPEIVRTNDELRVHPQHLIYIEPGSRLHSVAGDTLEAVNSIHHQCIANVSPLFDVVAWSLDGSVEAIERKDMPWQNGFQFHPESQRYTDPKYQALYDHLVQDGADFRDGKLPGTNPDL